MLELIKKLEKLKSKKDILKKQNKTLIITDFDDTIFSRKQQLENSQILRENRWDLWNKAIIEKIWLEKFIQDNYIWKEFPQNIINNMEVWKDLILTAWFEKIQKAKLKATKLYIYNHIIVEKAEDKIYETIRYVIEDLKFIPEKIIVYEDRPEFFIENKDLIENFLWTKLEIMLVEMIDNQTNPKIEKIKR